VIRSPNQRALQAGSVARHCARELSAKPRQCVVRERADLTPAGQRRGAVGKEGDGREETVLTRRHAELRRGPEELVPNVLVAVGAGLDVRLELLRSEEHTSELQSLA